MYPEIHFLRIRVKGEEGGLLLSALFDRLLNLSIIGTLESFYNYTHKYSWLKLKARYIFEIVNVSEIGKNSHLDESQYVHIFLGGSDLLNIFPIRVKFTSAIYKTNWRKFSMNTTSNVLDTAYYLVYVDTANHTFWFC